MVMSIEKLLHVLFVIIVFFELISKSHEEKTYFGCTKYYKLNMSIASDYDCQSLANKFSLELHTLEAFNPDLDCDTLSKIEHTPAICIEAHLPVCTKDYTVKEEDSFDSLVKDHSLKKKRFVEINPFANVKQLQVGQIVCLSARGSRTHHINVINSHFNNLMNEVHNVDQVVLINYNTYVNEPNGQSAHDYMSSVTDLVRNNQNVRDYFKKFEQTKEGQEYLKEQGLNHEDSCNKIDEYQYPLASKCFCDQNEPISYCSIVFFDEFQSKPLEKDVINSNNTMFNETNTDSNTLISKSKVTTTSLVK